MASPSDSSFPLRPRDSKLREESPAVVLVQPRKFVCDDDDDCGERARREGERRKTSGTGTPARRKSCPSLDGGVNETNERNKTVENGEKKRTAKARRRKDRVIGVGRIEDQSGGSKIPLLLVTEQ